MSKNWPSLIQAFSGKLTSALPHLDTCAIFDERSEQENPYICPLTNIAFLSVQGPDSKKFLQGQLTCDLNQISETIVSLSGHCTAKGRLLGIFHVIQLNSDHYCLALPLRQMDILQTSLKKYAIFSKVKIEIANLYSFGLVGNKTDFDKIDSALTKIKPYEKQDTNQICYINIPSPEAELLRFLVLFPNSDLVENNIIEYWKNLSSQGFKNRGTLDWHKLDILAQLPTIYPETNEKCLPHTLNLPKLGGVSFKKGCYTGQEIVARMEYLGNLKKTISCKEFNLPKNTLPILGESLSEDKPDHILLDYVPLEHKGVYLGLFVVDM